MGKDGKPNCKACPFVSPKLTPLCRDFINTFSRVSRFRDGMGGLSSFGLGIVEKQFGEHDYFYHKIMDFIAIADSEVRVWLNAKTSRKKASLSKKPR